MDSSNKIRVILIFLLFFGCQDKDSQGVDSYRIAKPEKAMIQLNSNSIQTTDLFSWTIPSGWIPVSSTQFSKANYLIPTATGSADLSVSYFGGDAGGIDANVNRWRTQLGLKEVNKEQIELMGEKFSSNIGEYRVFKIINPNNDERGFLCSVIFTKNQTIFIKLETYPSIIDSFKKQFIEFSSSFDYSYNE